MRLYLMPSGGYHHLAIWYLLLRRTSQEKKKNLKCIEHSFVPSTVLNCFHLMPCVRTLGYYLFLIFKFNIYFVLKADKGSSSTHWFTSQMPTSARARPCRSQEPQFRLSMQVAVTQALKILH